MPNAIGQPVVFISYAHESEAFKEQVKALADWLAAQGCEVLTDHPYRHRPPPEGWQAWMLRCIREADTVLVVGSPKYRACYEKTAPIGSGQGATYQGAILTQGLYDASMRNEKCYPILPDGGSQDDIPAALRDWWNDHWFPSGNVGIRHLIFDVPAQSDAAQLHVGAPPAASVPSEVPGIVAAPPPEPKLRMQEHIRLTTELLEQVDAKLFVSSLRTRLQEKFSIPVSNADTPTALVYWFLDQPSDQTQKLLNCVRKALQDVADGLPQRQAAEKAASALYFLCACGLVETAQLESEARGLHIRVPKNENIFCAVITVAMFGGKLLLKPETDDGLPLCQGVIEVPKAAYGERFYEEFERAVYCAMFPNSTRAGVLADLKESLNDADRAAIAQRFNTIREVQDSCLTLVVKGSTSKKSSNDFVTTYRVPLMSDSGVKPIGLAMQPDHLVENIREFWQELRETYPSPPGPGKGAATDSPAGQRQEEKTIAGDDSTQQALDSAGKKLDGALTIATKTQSIGALAVELFRGLFS